MFLEDLVEGLSFEVFSLLVALLISSWVYVEQKKFKNDFNDCLIFFLILRKWFD